MLESYVLLQKNKSKKSVAGVPREGCHVNREGLTETTSELSLEGGEGLSHANSWEKGVTSRRKSMCKGPAA